MCYGLGVGGIEYFRDVGNVLFCKGKNIKVMFTFIVKEKIKPGMVCKLTIPTLSEEDCKFEKSLGK